MVDLKAGTLYVMCSLSLWRGVGEWLVMSFSCTVYCTLMTT